MHNNILNIIQILIDNYSHTSGSLCELKYYLFLPYFLPRGDVNNYNVSIDGKNFYDQPTNDLIKQFDKVRKVSRGKGDDHTTGCLLDCA